MGLRLLFLGDIVGRPGRKAVAGLLPKWREEARFDLVVANGENAAGGVGLTPPIAEELWRAGVDVLTSGNHIWSKKEIVPLLDQDDRPLLRPANYPPGTPGRGVHVVMAAGRWPVGIINLQGRTFMDPIDSPFRIADQCLGTMSDDVRVILVDFHAEATSEKVALGWYLNGRVSAVIGTHTHIPTADERILPGGTAYLTDAGMCGPLDSVLGVETEIILRGFVTQLPVRHEVARTGPTVVSGAEIEVDPDSGKALSIRRVYEIVPVSS